jgi:hypothetical protein
VSAVAVLAVGLQVLADLAQARDDPPRDGYVRVIDVEIDSRRATAPAAHLAEELRLRCIPAHLDATVTMTGERTARFEILPAPGRTDHRKLRGCLEDLVVDRTLVRVRSDVELEAVHPVPDAPSA